LSELPLRGVLDALPDATAPLVGKLLGAARERGAAVFLVGGPVRDLLLGRPLADLDLVVEGGGAFELATAAAPQGARIVRYDRFGTVRLQASGAAIDLAGLRRETYAHPGALPKVEPAGLDEDLLRRDFTVNAMAIPLSATARKAWPSVVDPGGGRADLEARLLRVLHAQSFRDDPTRALRAARLATRLGFGLSRGTRSALRGALRDGAFGRVSGDRLRRELEKLFADARAGVDPARALALLDSWHVLGALEPGLELPRASRAPLRRLGRALAEPPWPLARHEPWGAGLAVWLAAVDAGLRRRALRRLAVRGQRAARVAEFPGARDRWLRGLERARGRGPVDATLHGIDEEQLLALAAWAPPTGRRRIERWAREDRGRRPPLGGADLVELGLAGADVGRALLRVRSAWLDGSVKSRDEALALAAELARRRAAARRRPGRGSGPTR
jgi:tRNA nucleotidyltransferase (CCA-adding enzyme)